MVREEGRVGGRVVTSACHLSPSGGPFYRAAKRSLDLVGSLVGLVALLPILLAVALSVRFASGRPVLYRPWRTGRSGVQFRILKFRTMEVGSDAGASTTSKNDRRVTPIGAILRRSKLDELPQLLNVLLGDMSLVGPRPELSAYTDLYDAREAVILEVKPGITDLSSIRFSELSSLIDDDDPEGSFERRVLPEKNRLRVEYAVTRSFLLDLRIILLTLLRVIFKR
jgi:lipopolysaccharide/colanic/teichoic acid biosynthesis glycosyltransferase